MTTLIPHAVQRYRRPSSTPQERSAVLQALAADGGAPALATLAELLVIDPPSRAEDALVGLAPLFRGTRQYAADALFPRLFDALAHPSVAAMVVDLANHVTRRGMLAVHPGANRGPQLANLYGSVVQQLRSLQQKAAPGREQNNAKLRQTFDDGFALVIALADALALIGDRSAVDVLRTGLELGHRRLYTEVAAALARLGEADGIDALVRMTGQAVVRNRALAYLDELGLGVRAPAEFATPQARSEGELASWLAEPMQFGLSPHEMSLLDHRTLYWPGYDAPVACWLWQYAYHVGTASLSGVGITGPVTYTLTADLEDLPPEDIYAAFAGWQAEHEEISEVEYQRATDDERDAAEHAHRLAETQGFQQVEPVKIASFFGQRHIVATARRGDDPGVVVIAEGRVHWLRSGNPRRPVGPTEAYYIFKGRELLRSFNV